MQYDQFRNIVQNTVEMPDRTVFLLYSFLSQNGGKLSKRAREGEGVDVSDDEIEHFKHVYDQVFAQ
ncbi:MAG: hypothetical protein WBI82_06215 [Sphaerochaeta sp.]